MRLGLTTDLSVSTYNSVFVSVSLSPSVSLSVSGIASCLLVASVSLALMKKPLSINGLMPSLYSFSVMCRRNTNSSTEPSKVPSLVSLASNQSIGASALLAIGKRMKSRLFNKSL